MGDPTSVSDTKTSNRGVTRSTGSEERGLANSLAAQRRSRQQQPLLHRVVLEEEMRRSRHAADQRLDEEIEAARRHRQPDEVRVTKPLQDPFGALEVGGGEFIGAGEVDGGPILIGIPRPPASPGKGDAELQKLLTEITRLRGKTKGVKPKNEVIHLRDLWLLLPEETRSKITATLHNPKALPVVKPPGTLSLQEAIRLLGKNNVAGLRQAGARVPNQLRDEFPLNHPNLNTVICYVGPGVGVYFDTVGEIIEMSFGPAFEMEAVREWGEPNGGMFFSLDLTETVRLFPTVEYRRAKFSVQIGGRLAEVHETVRLRQDRAVLFIISPSYWKRRGFRKALSGLPGRVKMAVRRAIDKDYLRSALGKEAKRIENMGASDVAELFLDLVLDWLSPIQTYEDTQDMMRLGRANIMAMGGAANEESDVDIAARLYAREVAAQALGAAIGGARKIGKKPSGAVRQDKAPETVTKSPPVPSSQAASPSQQSSRGTERRESDARAVPAAPPTVIRVPAESTPPESRYIARPERTDKPLPEQAPKGEEIWEELAEELGTSPAKAVSNLTIHGNWPKAKKAAYHLIFGSGTLPAINRPGRVKMTLGHIVEKSTGGLHALDNLMPQLNAVNVKLSGIYGRKPFHLKLPSGEEVRLTAINGKQVTGSLREAFESGIFDIAEQRAISNYITLQVITPEFEKELAELIKKIPNLTELVP